MIRIVYIIFLIATISALSGTPNSVKDLAVLIHSEIDSINNKIKLNWLPDSNTYKYFIYKKFVEDSTFGEPIAELSPNQNYFIDDLVPGIKVEYQVERDAWDYWAYGYILAGYNIEPVHNRGRVLILCDDSVHKELDDVLKVYMNDLSGDGWIPIIEKVPRATEFDYEKVAATKEIINRYYNIFNDLTAITLVGRVAVPYSGSFAVDGHSPDHDGAWPTDVYYAVFNGRWTDTIRNIKSEDLRIQNLPGDGKFDQTRLPASALLQIGRIDFYNLPAFKESEIELLRNYFINNHLFRNSVLKVPDSAIVNDYFGLDYREAFSASGWANFASIVGFENISEEQLRYTTRTKNYLFAYGCGPGSFNSVYQTAYTDELALEPFNVAFAMFFGSYNGDWDSEDNVLRATLAAQPLGLAVMWSGRPYWFLHHLGLGYNIGYSTLLSQNSFPDQYPANSPYARRFNHIALMGDPTLRTHYTNPIDNITITYSNSGILLNWNDLSIDNYGYYIYRANSHNGDYKLLNNIAIKDTHFTDNFPLPGENYYMVRSAKMQYTKSGSYLNLSTGKISPPIFFPVLDNNDIFRIFPNPATKEINIFTEKTDLFPSEISVFDVTGKHIFSTYIDETNPINHIRKVLLVDKSNAEIAKGIYFINLKNKSYNLTQKFIKQ